jgi:hypothetical protein
MRSSAVFTASIFTVVVACSAGNDKGAPSNLGPDDDGGATHDSGTIGPDSRVGGDDGGLNLDALPEVDATSCSSGDCDKDGYTTATGDCNDLDGTINPEAYDFPGDAIDNDCDGTVDDPVANCAADGASKDPTQFVRSADMCQQKSKTKTGAIFDPLVKAEWWTSKASGGFPPGATIGAGLNHASAVGVLPTFGSNAARNGTNMFLLQSGPILSTDPRGSSAMDGDGNTVGDGCSAIPLNADDCKSLTNGTAPIPGFPTGIEDYSEIRVTIHVPSNAQSMTFDFAFWSTEFNEYWHSPFNDAFFAIAQTSKFTTNVAKDSSGSAITVNSGFFQLCPAPPGPAGVSTPAALSNCVGVGGDASKKIFGTLAGTNFDGAGKGSSDDTTVDPADGNTYVYGGGSGWLTTKFGVDPGETIVVRFMIMDTSDGILDSAVLLDNFSWEKAPPKTATGDTTRPPS